LKKWLKHHLWSMHVKLGILNKFKKWPLTLTYTNIPQLITVKHLITTYSKINALALFWVQRVLVQIPPSRCRSVTDRRRFPATRLSATPPHLSAHWCALTSIHKLQCMNVGGGHQSWHHIYLLGNPQLHS
jgi:hypothetical protein